MMYVVGDEGGRHMGDDRETSIGSVCSSALRIEFYQFSVFLCLSLFTNAKEMSWREWGE